MSVERYYGMCQRYVGRAVEIRTRDGRLHRGIIQNVSRNRVFIRPFGGRPGLGGYGYGWYGGYGYRGFGYGIALGVITGVALTSLFFW